MGLGILESALVGAIGGWGEALAKLGEMEWKEEALKKREEYLTKSRMAEHAANKATDIRLVDDQRARDDARRGQFFKENRLPDQEIEGVEVDASGKEIGKIKGEGPADREDQAKHYAKRALETGDKGLIDMTRGEEDTLRKNSQEERRDRIAANKAEVDAFRLELQALRDNAKSANEAKRWDYLIAKLGASENTPKKLLDAEINDTLAKIKVEKDPKVRAELTDWLAVLRGKDPNADDQSTSVSTEEYDDQGRKKVTTVRGKGTAAPGTPKPAGARKPLDAFNKG